jgi:small conductance mechanosensitive channel
MDFLPRLTNALADGRLGVNLIAIHGVITVTVLLSLLLRRLVIHGGSQLGRWSGLRRLAAAGEEASRRARVLLFWLTVALVVLAVVGGVGYHMAGRDIRQDVTAWYDRLTVAELLGAGLSCAGLLAAVLAAWLAVGMVRRLRPHLEVEALGWFGRASSEAAVRRGLTWLQGYLVLAIRLTAGWALFKVLGAGEWATAVIGFLLRVLTILVVARLLTLSCRVLVHTLANLGEGYLGQGPFRHYWERVTRLVPFGERCLEAAVYVTAASLCVAELQFIAAMAELGPRIVQCIGIFFTTRVLIELLQVLLSEAFGLYSEEEPIDQKGRTLVPLLASIGQYVLYFGSVLVMLGVLGVDTRPILAGAGILGLAVGLGAQSLVTDVVSGFFILFENQYLVGDHVQIGDATGVVEAVGIRVTQLRDGYGRVYLIPNGQIKGVVSYSKGFVNAVVDWKVPSGSDLEGLFRAMAEAGRQLRQNHPEVLADTHIHGLVDWSTSEMTVRAVTKVRPGTHAVMQNEYRRLLKQILDQNAATSSRPALAA